MNSSDEAVEAALAACNAPDVLDLRDALTKAYPIIAAAVRAEAVADERRRITELESELAKYKRLIADMKTIGESAIMRRGEPPLLAAGSVPVATPKPTVCEFCRRADGGHERSCLTNLPEVPVATPEQRTCTWCDQPASGTAWGHLPDGPQPSCGEHGHRFQPSPVATPPAEPAGDEDETPTGKITQAEAEALRTKAAPIDLLASLKANLPPAPSQPVTCEHGETVGHWASTVGPRVHWLWCPGPVSVPKESSE